MIQEEWKDVPFNNSYQVSNLGRVKRVIFRINPTTHETVVDEHYMKIFKSGVDDASTCRVELTHMPSEYSRRDVYVANLVAACFLDIPYCSCMIHHIDGDSNNNVVTNLTADVTLTKWYRSTIAPDEEWRGVAGYEDDYQVSSYGRFRTLPRMISHSRNGYNFRKGVIHTFTDQADQHICVQLWRDGKQHQYMLHRLVADAFIPNPENKPFVNHIDGNKRNNKITNLEWVTARENTQHAIRTGLMNNDGRSVPVICITTGKRYDSIAAAARDLSIYRGSISESIYRGRAYAGYQFKLADDMN